MWLFPYLSVLVAGGIVAILLQMAFNATARPQLLESLGAWAAVVILYWRGPGGSRDRYADRPPGAAMALKMRRRQ